MPELNWQTLVETFYQEIYRYCYFMLGSRHDAEDATQESFLKAWKNFESLKSYDKSKGWLYAIARRNCIDKRRWWSRFHKLFEPKQADFPSPISNELALILLELVSKLPLRQREVFVLRHWQGFSTKEVATHLKLSEGTVKSHLKRAIDSLKREIFLKEPT